MHRWFLGIGFALVASGCFASGGSNEGGIQAARDPVAIAIQNQHFNDMRVYWVRTGGAERRLGIVNGNSFGRFEVRWETGDLQLRFDFIGGRSVLTRILRVSPGDVVEIRMDPQGRYTVLSQ